MHTNQIANVNLVRFLLEKEYRVNGKDIYNREFSVVKIDGDIAHVEYNAGTIDLIDGIKEISISGVVLYFTVTFHV